VEGIKRGAEVVMNLNLYFVHRYRYEFIGAMYANDADVDAEGVIALDVTGKLQLYPNIPVNAS
jgi:hypothetical protein